MRKVAIVTYQYNNYGTKLQNYAMKRAIANLGFEVSSVSISPRKDTFIILAKLLIKTSPSFIFKKYGRFNRFDKKYLNKFSVTYNGLKKLDNSFDYFVSGSDQVWSPRHLRTRVLDRGLFLLSFSTVKKKKIAYAPSFGVEALVAEDLVLYGKHLEDFGYLSVREPSGVEILKTLTNGIPEVVPDPTLLLTKDEWADVTRDSDEKYSTKRYLAVYYLSAQPKEIHSRIVRYALANNLEVITVSGDLYTKGSIVPGPAEFVSIIKNAQVVFTDSFHACVFSIINETPFIVRQRSDVSQFTRIENLLSKYDLEGAVDSSKSVDEIVASLDFSESINEIDIQRNKGMDYLKGALK